MIMQLFLLVCIYVIISLHHAILNYFKPIDYNDGEGRVNCYLAGER